MSGIELHGQGKARRTGTLPDADLAEATPTAEEAEAAYIKLLRSGYATDEQWAEVAEALRGITSAGDDLDSLVDGIMDESTATSFKGGGRLYSAGT